MLIKLEKSSLLRAVLIADSVIQGKAVNSIIDNCLIKVFSDCLEIISTDKDISIKTNIPSESDSEGIITCDGKKLAQILKELPDGIITIKTDNNLMVLKSSTVKGDYKLITTDGEDFPEIEFGNFDLIQINQSQFKKMIKKVLYAAAHDSVKPVFNGVYIQAGKNSTLNMVASDSRRLSFTSEHIDMVEQIVNNAVIPLKTINEVYKLLDAGVFNFALNEKQCCFKIGNTTIISRLIDGNFPDFEKVIPKDFIDTIIIDTKKFINSLRRVMIFTKEPTYKIIMTFKNDVLKIEARTPEYGEASEEIAIESSSSQEIMIGINGQYLMDSAKEIDTISFRMNITGAMSPVTMMPDDTEDSIAVIMPIQIRSAE
ncbi:MAG: DNA polymerase III subunit beta [Spirochaetes bacterium]|jgi:DNA polymerase-3 subunit beta|nr:DNA polymerase III subunit beta [Spirochaetota bacterium]